MLTKKKLDLSWRAFASRFGISYTTVRDWRDEKWSMQLDVFNKIVEICPEQKCFEEFIIETKQEGWGRKLGGLVTKQRQHGFLNPVYSEQSLAWKSNGGHIGTSKWHSRMREEKPEEYGRIQYERIKQSLSYKLEFDGKRYRNSLELEVAKILTQNNIGFEYEPVVKCDGRTYFPDFVVDKIAIECTFWDDVNKKARELTKKIQNYRKLELEIFVVTKGSYLDRYLKAFSPSNVRVITPNKLTKELDGKFGRVKRA